MNALRGDFSHLRSVNRFFAAVDAIAAREIFRIRRLHRFVVDDDAPAGIQFEIRNLLEKRTLFLLPDGFDDYIAGDFKH